MDKAFAWLEQLTTFIYRLFPHIIIVNANEQAVKFKRGRIVCELDPGWHLYWPLLTEKPTRQNVTRDASAYLAQKLTTKDGRRVAISLVLVFKVVDVVAALVDTYDFETTMSDIVRAAATKSVFARDWSELTRDTASGSLQEELFEAVREELVQYGIDTLGIRVRDLTETLVLSLLGDGCLTGAFGE